MPNQKNISNPLFAFPMVIGERQETEFDHGPDAVICTDRYHKQ